MELEVLGLILVAVPLRQERQRRMAVLQQREEWTAQHRQKTEELERELQDTQHESHV